MHIKTVILLGNFFRLVCVMLLVCQQRFLFNVFLRFLFFHKERIFNVFYSWGQRFLHLCGSCGTHSLARQQPTSVIPRPLNRIGPSRRLVPLSANLPYIFCESAIRHSTNFVRCGSSGGRSQARPVRLSYMHLFQLGWTTATACLQE